jgi:DNA-binding CsgD family transcriptional regulator
MAVKAVKDGAVDFFQKPYREQQLLDAIDEALRRDATLRSHPATEGSKRLDKEIAALTLREREVMQLALKGLPSKVIAKDLDISYRTVEQHRSRLLAKPGEPITELMRLHTERSPTSAATRPRTWDKWPPGWICRRTASRMNGASTPYRSRETTSTLPSIHQGQRMTRLLAAMIAVLFAAGAYAQNPPGTTSQEQMITNSKPQQRAQDNLRWRMATLPPRVTPTPPGKDAISPTM